MLRRCCCPTAVPILVGQGGRDPLVLPEVTETLVARVCRQGADVTYRRYPAATHDDIGPAASEDVLAWLANVLAGRHVRSEDCPC